MVSAESQEQVSLDLAALSTATEHLPEKKTLGTMRKEGTAVSLTATERTLAQSVVRFIPLQCQVFQALNEMSTIRDSQRLDSQRKKTIFFPGKTVCFIARVSKLFY